MIFYDIRLINLLKTPLRVYLYYIKAKNSIYSSDELVIKGRNTTVFNKNHAY